MAKIKLSDPQKQALEILQKRPTAMVMNNGYLTGGCGIKMNLATICALQKMGLVDRDWRISDLGKSIDLTK